MLKSLLLLMLMVFGVFFISGLWAFWNSKSIWVKIAKVIISFIFVGIFLVINSTWDVSELHDFKNVSAQVSVINSLFSLYFVTVLFNVPSYFGNLKEYQLTTKGKIVKMLTELSAASFAPAMYMWSKMPTKCADLVDFLVNFAIVTVSGIAMFGLIYALIRNIKPIWKALYTKTKLHDYINDVLPNLNDGEKNMIKAIRKEGLISIDESSNSEKLKYLKGLTNHGIPILIYKLNNTLFYTFGDDGDIDERLIDGPIQNCGFYSCGEKHLVKKEVIKKISERTGASEKTILKKLEEFIDD